MTRLDRLIDRCPNWLAGLITVICIAALAYLATGWNGVTP